MSLRENEWEGAVAKVIWMSDLHFVHEGTVLGYNPRVRLRMAIDHINAHHADAEMCIISGDLVNRGTSADYAALAQELERLSVPYYPMVGNHDDRALLRTHLPIPETTQPEFVQYSLETPVADLLCLDTQCVGQDAGESCDRRSDWLRSALRDAGAKPVYIFMHHPPMALGLPMQDLDCMRDGERFLDLISAFQSVRHLFIGHVHRPITGVVRGIPYATMRSVLYQAPPPQPAWDWDSFAPAREAPALGVLSLLEGDVALHYDQFCSFETGVAVT